MSHLVFACVVKDGVLIFDLIMPVGQGEPVRVDVVD